MFCVSGASARVERLPQQAGAVDLLLQANVELDGAAAGDEAGVSVAAAGDVNGDGLRDVTIGALGADNNGRTDSSSCQSPSAHPPELRSSAPDMLCRPVPRRAFDRVYRGHLSRGHFRTSRTDVVHELPSAPLQQ
jgi:hypothetical protein